MSAHHEISVSGFERDVEDIIGRLGNSATFHVMLGIRDTLTKCGMSPSYRDQFIAHMDLSFPSDLSEEQLERVTVATQKFVKALYELFKSHGFNDQAISLMPFTSKLD